MVALHFHRRLQTVARACEGVNEFPAYLFREAGICSYSIILSYTAYYMRTRQTETLHQHVFYACDQTYNDALRCSGGHCRDPLSGRVLQF